MQEELGQVVTLGGRFQRGICFYHFSRADGYCATEKHHLFARMLWNTKRCALNLVLQKFTQAWPLWTRAPTSGACSGFFRVAMEPFKSSCFEQERAFYAHMFSTERIHSERLQGCCKQEIWPQKTLKAKPELRNVPTPRDKLNALLIAPRTGRVFSIFLETSKSGDRLNGHHHQIV